MKSKALLFLAMLSQLTCHQALFVAPPNTDMQCFPNPDRIPADRGVSVISCFLQEETGSPVADGTVVQFFTTLGRIPEQGRTNDGVVRVNFESTGRSGTARIAARSGGGSGITTPTSSTLTPTSTTINVLRPFAASDNQASGAVAGVAATFDFTVDIGNATAADLFLSAEPTRITETRPSTITANVVDGDGNPISGVAVFFSVSGTGVTPPTGTPTPGGAAPTESLDSQGQPVFTDTNGQARDVLRTRWPRDAGPRSVTVTARTSTNESDSIPVAIN
ncbi:MAG: hypothetical protein ABW221_07200 [Vicinamibacteria bacterium]